MRVFKNFISMVKMQFWGVGCAFFRILEKEKAKFVGIYAIAAHDLGRQLYPE